MKSLKVLLVFIVLSIVLSIEIGIGKTLLGTNYINNAPIYLSSIMVALMISVPIGACYFIKTFYTKQ